MICELFSRDTEYGTPAAREDAGLHRRARGCIDCREGAATVSVAGRGGWMM
jgi:hypothetical protein